MMTVKEVSRITGVSVRTLHHYDAVGLLKPSALNGAGYRLYDSAGGDGTAEFAKQAIEICCAEE